MAGGTTAPTPFVCHICKFPTEMDDVMLRLADETVICLRCFEREVKDTRQVSKRMQRDVDEA